MYVTNSKPASIAPLPKAFILSIAKVSSGFFSTSSANLLPAILKPYKPKVPKPPAAANKDGEDLTTPVKPDSKASNKFSPASPKSPSPMFLTASPKASVGPPNWNFFDSVSNLACWFLISSILSPSPIIIPWPGIDPPIIKLGVFIFWSNSRALPLSSGSVTPNISSPVRTPWAIKFFKPFLGSKGKPSTALAKLSKKPIFSLFWSNLILSASSTVS